jgi:pantoate--beta-alanine ligase
MSDTSKLETVNDAKGLGARVKAWRDAGLNIALVPTMGALHSGHGVLMDQAAQACDRVIVSIFVNPTQFGPNEDFKAYPRDGAADTAFLRERRVDLLYAPDVDALYPDGLASSLSAGPLSQNLCGEHRPGHFDGVATVVARLLEQAQPDRAYFGEKDYQQLCVIRHTANEQGLAVAIEGVGTVREADGLAISSRNAYLSDDERTIAPVLFQTITDVAAKISEGQDASDAVDILAEGVAKLHASGFGKIDYLACMDATSLHPQISPSRPARVFVAARLGAARLIDNVAVPGWPK